MYSQAVSPSLAPALDSEYEGGAAGVVEHKVGERGEMEGQSASASSSAPTSSSSVGAAGPTSSSRGRDRKRVTKSETNADKSVPTTPPGVTSSSSVSHKRTRSTKAPPTSTTPPAVPAAVESKASRFDQYAYSPSDKNAHHTDTTTASTSARKRGRPAKAK